MLHHSSRVISVVFTLLISASALSAANSAYQTAVLADNPLSYFRFNETSGTAADDLQSASNGIYLNSPTLGVSGDTGGGASDNAVTLDGTNDGVRLATGTTLGSSLGSSSLEFVFSTPSNVTSLGTLFNAQATGSNTAVTVTLNSKASGTNLAGVTRLFYRAQGGGAVSFELGATAGAALYTGDFVHLVVTFDQTLATANQLSVYINGTLVTSGITNVVTGGGITGSSVFSSFLTDNTGPMIGSNKNAAPFMTGTVDEFASYGSILSAANIADHYLALTSIPEPSVYALFGGLAVGALAIGRRRRAQR